MATLQVAGRIFSTGRTPAITDALPAQ
jgi:hypothetical protein